MTTDQLHKNPGKSRPLHRDPTVGAARPAGPRRPGGHDHADHAGRSRHRLLDRRSREGPRGLLHRRGRGRGAARASGTAAARRRSGWSARSTPTMMKALYTHGLDPRDPNTADRETWHKAERFGNPPRNYKTAEEIYAELLDQHPDAGPEERAELRAQAGAVGAAVGGVLRPGVVGVEVAHAAVGGVRARPPATPPPPATRRPRPSTRRVAGILEEALMVGHRGDARTSSPRRPGTPAPGITAAAAGSGSTRTTGPPRSSCSTTRATTTRSCTSTAPSPNKVVCADGKVRALDFSLILQWRDAACAYADRLVEAYAVAAARRVVGAAPRTGSRGRSPGSTSRRRSCSPSAPPRSRPPCRSWSPGSGRRPGARPPTGSTPPWPSRRHLVTRAAKVFGGETRDGQLARWAAEYDAAFGATSPRSPRQALGRAPAAADAVLRAGRRHPRVGGDGGHPPVLDPLEPDDGGLQRPARPPRHRARTDRAAAGGPDRQGRGAGPAPEPAHRPAGPGREVLPGRRRERVRQAALGSGSPPPTSSSARTSCARPRSAAAPRPGRPRTPTRSSPGSPAPGATLGADQAAALRGILTSGAAVEVLNAPAGTGKSFLVGTLADTWPLTGRPCPTRRRAGPGTAAGVRRRLRATPGRRARRGRRDRPQHPQVARRPGPPRRRPRQRRRRGVPAPPRGPAGRRRGRGRLDPGPGRDPPPLRGGGGEAAAGRRPEAARRRRRRRRAGRHRRARHRVPARRGPPLPPNAWEGPASLRLRDGDTTVVGEYAKHGRLVDAGTIEQAEQAAGRAWLADTLDGRDALIVVGSNAAAARLSNQLRAQLVKLGRVDEHGVPLGHGPDPLGVARHRRRGRRPGPGPPQRLAPGRLGGQRRGADQPADLPGHRPPTPPAG